MTQTTTSDSSNQRSTLSHPFLNLNTLVSSLIAGLVIGMIGVIRAISYATLIFVWPLSDQIPVGIGMTVLSTGIIAVVVALLSAYPGMIATPLAAPTVLLAVLAKSIAQSLKQAEAPPETLLITVLAAIALVSIFTGLLFLVLGLTKQGDRIRVIPYPVVGGFMVGTGWLLVSGFIQITTDLPLTFQTLPMLVQADELLRWLPGVGFALILLAASRKIQHFMVIPTVLLLSTGIFYGALAITHTSLSEAREAGLLLQIFSGGTHGMGQLLTPQALSQVQWSVLGTQMGSMLTVSIVTLLSLLLSNNAIELAIGRDLNLDRELVAVGCANLSSGLLSGMVGTQALPSTVLAHDMQAPYRLTGVFTLIPVIAVLGLGTSFLGYLPQAILGSLILYLGISLFIQWLVEGWSQLTLASYSIIIVMLITVAKFGLLQGIGLGFLLTVLHFAYAYSQLAVIKATYSGDSTRSNVGRSSSQQEYLTQQGDCIHLIELQGFIFFGTAPYLLKHICDRALKGSDAASSHTPADLSYLVLDFKQVKGLDASAVSTMGKILKLAKQQHFQLLLTNLSEPFKERLVRGKGFEPGEICHVFPDMDRALEWAETQLLQNWAEPMESQLLSSVDDDRVESVKSLPEALQVMLTEIQSQQFLTYLDPLQLPCDQPIFAKGSDSSGIYFITAGQVSVLLDFEDGRTKRLQTCTQGHVLGEMRFFGKEPLSSRVVTDTETHLLYLSPTAFQSMKQAHPDLSHALQDYIVKVLCDSLIRREEQLRVMQ